MTETSDHDAPKRLSTMGEIRNRLAAVKLAYERRAMCASRVGDVDVMRACLAHLNFNAKQQVQARIDAIAKDKAQAKGNTPEQIYAQRFRGSNGARITEANPGRMIQHYGNGAMGAPATETKS